MIVISAGMPKSGSAWYFNLINDVLVVAGCSDVRDIRERFGLDSILLHHNCNIGELNHKTMLPLLAPHNLGHTFVVKTHEAPTPFVQHLINEGTVKATYIFRDPRDVVLSAMDHGRRIRESGQYHTFADCETLEKTVGAVKQWLGIWEQWKSINGVLCIRYENLLQNAINELKRLIAFLGLDGKHIDAQNVIARYNKENLDHSKNDYLHFNEGIAERFRALMNPQELAYCRDQFGHSLEKMGCEI